MNLLRLLTNALDSGIESGRNILGGSDLPKCAGKVIISKIYDIKVYLNNKMLFGMMYEEVLYKPIVLTKFLSYMMRHLELEEGESLTEVDTKKGELWEVFPEEYPDHFIRLHPDVYTNLFTVEIKTTAMYAAKFSKDLAPYYVMQENFYMGYYKQHIGFLHKLNFRAFLATLPMEEIYWERLWDEYAYFVPIFFDEVLYNLSLLRAKFLFHHIDIEDWDVPRPELTWECNYCDDFVRKKCGNPISSLKLEKERYEDCSHCGKKLLPEENIFVRNGKYYCKPDPKDNEEGACQIACKAAWKVE
jgi:hypothetical protein